MKIVDKGTIHLLVNQNVKEVLFSCPDNKQLSMTNSQMEDYMKYLNQNIVT